MSRYLWAGIHRTPLPLCGESARPTREAERWMNCCATRANGPRAISRGCRSAASPPRRRRWQRWPRWAVRCRRGRSARGGAGAARRGRLAGDGGLGGRALLRLRHRRLAARALAANWLAAAWDQNAVCSVDVAGGGGAGGDRARLAGGSARPAGGHRRGRSSPARRWPTSPRWPPRATPCWPRVGWDVEADGLFGAPPITRGGRRRGALRRCSRRSACSGWAASAWCACPWTTRAACAPTRCRDLAGPAIVCLQAGNVNTGAFDPLRRLIAVGARSGRVGACGWRVRPLGGGRARARAPGRRRRRADSWATDAHKWLNVPYDSGLAFVRDAGGAARGDGSQRRRICRSGERREPMQLHAGVVAARARRGGLGGAALAGAQRAWPSWSSAAAATRHASPRGCAPAGYEVLNEVVLNQVLVRFGDDRDDAPRDRRGAGGRARCWCGPTVWQGRAAMRISVSSWATTTEDVERSLAAILRVAREVM